MDMLLSDSDWESFSESGSSEDQEDIDSMYGGKAQSILSSLEETIGKIDDFLSFERGFIHGDIVCSVADPSGQMGRVVEVDMLVDLENVYGKVIKDVNSKKLLKIRSISIGDYVVLGPWLGRVNKVVDSVTILFDDGAKCEVTATDHKKIFPISPDLLEDPQYQYYPGQRVQVRLSTLSKSARWLCGAWKENRTDGTVCAVEAGLVSVDWLASALVGSGLSLPAPPCWQDSKKLTLLSCFSHANWQLGDWCMLPVSDRKGVMEKHCLSVSTCEHILGHMKLERGFKRMNLSFERENIFVMVKIKTKVDVQWQDGSCSVGLDPQSLFPINIVDAHEFWPEQFVLEKGTCDDPNVSSSQRWGVVEVVDAKERIVKVKWKNFALNEGTDLEEGLMEETVSAYELVEHPDYSYCLGDFVFRLERNQLVDQADGQNFNNNAIAEMGMGKENPLKGETCSKDQNEYSDKYYSSHIGNVVGFKDGGVKVKWATGFTTQVAPNEIFRIDKFEGSSTTPEENIEELNHELIEDDNQSSPGKEKDVSDLNIVDKDCKKYPWQSTSSLLPQAVIGFFLSIAASLFGSPDSTLLSGQLSSSHCSEDENESGTHLKGVLNSFNPCTEEQHIVVDDLRASGETSVKEEIKEIGGDKDLPFSSGSKNPEQFSQFDMVCDCSDHHFVDSASKGLALSQVKKGWLKKVHQEWSMLEKNLPETIYVRIYEERIDLLRAAIVGPSATPYHDGLFFFDIFLPPEYPHEPPLVHYNSGGLRVNPNLYESGKVCLSLLNTWTGTGTEVWNPGSSTILQVLLSLQALVLNEKPYFNEAGYDKQMGRAEGEKNSISYNENAFIGTCRSILYLLRNPPKHFEALVEEHFNQCSQHFLLACKAYIEGAPVGCAFEHKKTAEESQKGSSTGFKIMLAKLFPKLVEAFSARGIDCSQFVEMEKGICYNWGKQS